MSAFAAFHTNPLVVICPFPHREYPLQGGNPTHCVRRASTGLSTTIGAVIADFGCAHARAKTFIYIPSEEHGKSISNFTNSYECRCRQESKPALPFQRCFANCFNRIIASASIGRSRMGPHTHCIYNLIVCLGLSLGHSVGVG